MNAKANRVKISALSALFFIFINTTALAGGLYLNEFGTPSMGVAGAGANAVASDASTSFHNPGRYDPDQRQGINGYGRTVKCDCQVRSGCRHAYLRWRRR